MLHSRSVETKLPIACICLLSFFYEPLGGVEMATVISVFNNKGGVGKTNIVWNLGDAIARKNKRVLLIDFDPQCNLSIAVLGQDKFVKLLPQENHPYGTCIRAYLQRFLQNTGREEIFLHKGEHSSDKMDLVAGDFWLNVYSESLNVGNDLLSGTGIAKYVVLHRMIKAAERKASNYDFVLIDLPPSFGGLVRAALYSSQYFIVPCTSDNFSAYCVGLIGQMLPNFIKDWAAGVARFKESNPGFSDYDDLGQPRFAGWIFNGFDMRKGVEVRADAVHGDHITKAVKEDLVSKLAPSLFGYNPVADGLSENYRLGGIEDMNTLIQNSLWQNVPLSRLENVQQLRSLTDRGKWADNQIAQIRNIKKNLNEIADKIINSCTIAAPK